MTGLSSMAKTTLPFEEFVVLILFNSRDGNNEVPLSRYGMRGPDQVIISGMLYRLWSDWISQASYIVVQEKDQWENSELHRAPPRKMNDGSPRTRMKFKFPVRRSPALRSGFRLRGLLEPAQLSKM